MGLFFFNFKFIQKNLKIYLNHYWKMQKIDLDDCRFVTNKILSKSLDKRVEQLFKEINDPSLDFFSSLYRVVINIENVQYINVYTPLYPMRGNIIINGAMVNTVFFPSVKSFEDLINAFTTDENQKFIIQKTFRISYKKEDQSFQEVQYLYTPYVLFRIKKIIKPEITDRIFNIITPEFKDEGLFIWYQKNKDYKIAQVLDVRKRYKPVSKGKIKIDNSCTNCKSNNSFFHLFRSNKKSGKTYEKLT